MVQPSRWRCDGLTALITGASRGIGLASAREFAGLGADLLLVSRHEDTLEQIAEEIIEQHPARRVETLSADLSDGEGRASVLDWLKEIDASVDVLVNNVGNNLRRAALGYSDQDLQFIFSTNVASAFEMSRLLHPWLQRSAHPAIVNVASVSGLTHVRTGAAYGMSKAAIVQMTKNLACEWAVDRIRVNAVAPWYIYTDRTESALADSAYRDDVIDRTPLARIGEAHEVAAAIAFLAMPCASYITGQCLAVDGGFMSFGF
jgi:tropinone reductase I